MDPNHTTAAQQPPAVGGTGTMCENTPFFGGGGGGASVGGASGGEDAIRGGPGTPFGNADYGYGGGSSGGGAGYEDYEGIGGHWKDGLLDCLRHGLFHPWLLNGIFCPQILMAQVLTRMKLNWVGQEDDDFRVVRNYDSLYTDDSDEALQQQQQQQQQYTAQQQQQSTGGISSTRSSKTFVRIAGVVAFYWISTALLAPQKGAQWIQDPDTHQVVRIPPPPRPFLSSFLYNVISWGFALYTLIVLTRLRRAVRRRYNIPTSSSIFSLFYRSSSSSLVGPLGGPGNYYYQTNTPYYSYSSSASAMEDVCVSFWCGCCSVTQLARQTCDSNHPEDAAECCSPTGLKQSHERHYQPQEHHHTIISTV